jgi:hypothetical protein
VRSWPAARCEFPFFPQNQTLGATMPAGSEPQSFVLAVILTFLLMLTILNVSTGAKEKGHHGGDRRRSGDCVGGNVCRADLRRVHESGSLVCPGTGFRSLRAISGFTSSRRSLAPVPPLLACRCVREGRLLFNSENRNCRMSKQNILFVCVHNSARSQMAEAFLNQVCSEQFQAQQRRTGTGQLNPIVVEAMQENRP